MEILVKMQLWSYEIDQTYFLVSDQYDDPVTFFEEEAGPIAANAVSPETDARSYFLKKLNSGEFIPKAAYNPEDADEVWWIHCDIYYMRANMGKQGTRGDYECGRTPSAEAFVDTAQAIQED